MIQFRKKTEESGIDFLLLFCYHTPHPVPEPSYQWQCNLGRFHSQPSMV